MERWERIDLRGERKEEDREKKRERERGEKGGRGEEAERRGGRGRRGERELCQQHCVTSHSPFGRLSAALWMLCCL